MAQSPSDRARLNRKYAQERANQKIREKKLASTIDIHLKQSKGQTPVKSSEVVRSSCSESGRRIVKQAPMHGGGESSYDCSGCNGWGKLKKIEKE